MKMKMKVLAAAVGLVIAGGASASIDPLSTGNGELWLSVRNNTDQTSMMIGLNLNIDGSTAGSTAFSTTTSQTFSLTAVQNYLTANTGDNFSWMVTAGDSVGSASVDGLRYLSTSLSPTGVATFQNQALVGFNTMESPLTNINSGSKDGVVVGSSDVAYFATSMDSWQNKAPFSATAALGQSMGFYQLSNSGSTTGPSTKLKAVNFATFDGTWKLDSTGSLQYTVASVPAVPVPAAVWLLGSALIGMVGVARRKVSAV